MKTILITGGLGHIGSALINNIKDNIIVVDDFSSQRYCSLFNNKKRFKFIDKKFINLSLDEIMDVDVVVHLAAITDASESFKKAKKVYKINVTETAKFFKNIYNNTNVKLIVFPSSTSVYGKASEIMYENDININPQSPYAESKIEIENVLKNLQRNSHRKDIGYIVFRFGTIFGISPGMRFHTAINKFCYQAVFGKPLTVWIENYEHYRPYLGINDAVEVIKWSFNVNSEMINNIYNVLSGNYKLSNIIEFLKNEINIDVNFINTPLINQHSYFVNDDKIRNCGFLPKDNLQQEIIKTLKLLGGL